MTENPRVIDLVIASADIHDGVQEYINGRIANDLKALILYFNTFIAVIMGGNVKMYCTKSPVCIYIFIKL